MIRSLLIQLGVLAALTSITRSSLAQGTCGTPPTNFSVSSSVCSNGVRISWTNPVGVGVVNPRVWRSATDNFADATLVHFGGSGSATTITNTPPVANVNYYYWVGGDVYGCGGSAPTQTQPLPRVGPLVGGSFTVNMFPAPRFTPTCSGVRVDFQQAWDASSFEIVRGSSRTAAFSTIATLPNQISSPVSSYEDTDCRPGNQYVYGMIVNASCGRSSQIVITTHRAGGYGNPVGVSSLVNVGETGSLSVSDGTGNASTVMVPAPQSLEWFRNGVSLANTPRFSGVFSSTLTITNVRLEDEGFYHVRVMSSCPSQPLAFIPVLLSVRQNCRADFDQNGSASAADIFEFLNSWFAGCP